MRSLLFPLPPTLLLRLTPSLLLTLPFRTTRSLCRLPFPLRTTRSLRLTLRTTPSLLLAFTLRATRSLLLTLSLRPLTLLLRTTPSLFPLSFRTTPSLLTLPFRTARRVRRLTLPLRTTPSLLTLLFRATPSLLLALTFRATRSLRLARPFRIQPIPDPVVHLPFLRVDESVVRLVDPLEPLSRPRLLAPVRMMQLRKTPERPPNRILRRPPAYPENVVVIIRHARHSRVPPSPRKALAPHLSTPITLRMPSLESGRYPHTPRVTASGLGSHAGHSASK